MRVLLVEDSEQLQRSLSAGLRNSGYAVDSATNGNEALWLADSNVYDVIILDLMLPGKDGLSVLRNLRESGKNTHVLILTARDTVADRVIGLRAGADDYLAKPFAFDELVARVEALMRRSHFAKNPKLKIGPIEMDTVARRVSRGAESIDLSPREFSLLHYLAVRQGQVVSRNEIESHIYDDRAELMSNVVDAAVYALRRKIDKPGETSLIQTRRGMGYVLGGDEA